MRISVSLESHSHGQPARRSRRDHCTDYKRKPKMKVLFSHRVLSLNLRQARICRIPSSTSCCIAYQAAKRAHPLQADLWAILCEHPALARAMRQAVWTECRTERDWCHGLTCQAFRLASGRLTSLGKVRKKELTWHANHDTRGRTILCPIAHFARTISAQSAGFLATCQ
jgi:hypothetical protein